MALVGQPMGVWSRILFSRRWEGLSRGRSREWSSRGASFDPLLATNLTTTPSALRKIQPTSLRPAGAHEVKRWQRASGGRAPRSPTSCLGRSPSAGPSSATPARTDRRHKSGVRHLPPQAVADSMGLDPALSAGSTHRRSPTRPVPFLFAVSGSSASGLVRHLWKLARQPSARIEPNRYLSLGRGEEGR